MRVRLIVLALAIVAAVVLGLLFRETISLALQGHTKAKLGTNQAQAAAKSGSDAVNTVSDVAGRDAAGDALTRENDHAIRSALGASAPVDPSVRDAGLRGLCKRPAYSRDPRCLLIVTPKRVAEPGAGGAAPGR